jgi:hypothetical protein
VVILLLSPFFNDQERTMRLIRTAVYFVALFISPLLNAAEKVVLVTLDGLRWQEMFTGIDEALLDSEKFTSGQEALRRDFWDPSPKVRAQKLMPFFHDTLFVRGSYAGDLELGSCAEVSNRKNFSYPGYSEILTGVVDPSIDSNDKVFNRNKSFMELLLEHSQRTGADFSAAAFASWDVFPFIINTERSGIYVNAFGPLQTVATPEEKVIQGFYFDTPRPWTTVRHDVFTHRFALEYLRREQPDVLYVSYGETDDFAHDGKYHEYILAANRTDRFISELWSTLQGLDAYRDKTVLFITTDHGRGESPLEEWQHHSPTEEGNKDSNSLLRYARGETGEEAVWFAAMGPGINEKGLIDTGGDCLTSNRVAASLLQALGIDYRELNSKMGAPMDEFFR